MTSKFQKQVLKVVVGQICQTIGWGAINSSALETLIDVLHRYILELARTTHLFSDQFGHTQPNLDDLGLAFNEMGISINELREYVEFVDSVPCNLAVPKYPIPKESHLNFLKPGSQEVMTRPVHVNEHLPPTIELSVETNLDATSSPQPSPTFKRPGDPVDAGAAKRVRLGLEEEGRPLREISSVMMTTGGFISPAREGKLPEPRLALPASDLRSSSPPLYPSVPPQVNRENREKKKKLVEGAPKEKDREKKKEKRHHGPDSQVKKLVGMKEVAKLKALKSNASKHSPLAQNPHHAPSVGQTPEKSLIQKLAESPHLVVTPVPTEPTPPVVKLATEPDKQKLNIFKKISKVKEEEAPQIIKEESTFSSPGSPSTPKTPDILKSPEHKKKKKDKDREKKKRNKEHGSDRVKEHVESDRVERRPKTPDVSITLPPPTFSFFPPGLVPPVISNPLIPRFPGPLGPNFPNLPLPPPFLQQPKPEVKAEAVPSSTKSPLAILLGERKEKDHKKEKKEKKKKKDKDRDKEKDKEKEKDPEKIKEKTKKEKKDKKHTEEKHKSKDKKEKKEKRKEKDKEKIKDREREKTKEKEKEREKEKEKDKEKIKEEVAVPKLTLKLATPNTSRPASPRRPVEEEPKPKASKSEEPPRKEKNSDKQTEPNEIARISALFSKPTNQEQKPLHVQTESLKLPKEVPPLQKSPGTIIDKDGNKVWICPSCGRPDDGTPMIGCDECDAWYHWVCVGIQVPPDENEDWYCRFCIVKKQGSGPSKKKRGRKRKPPV